MHARGEALPEDVAKEWNEEDPFWAIADTSSEPIVPQRPKAQPKKIPLRLKAQPKIDPAAQERKQVQKMKKKITDRLHGAAPRPPRGPPPDHLLQVKKESLEEGEEAQEEDASQE